MNDIFTSYIKLPLKVQGLVVPTPEGDYRILLNSALSPAQQQQTYHHEMRHILLGHYQQPLRPIREIEAEADAPGLIIDQIHRAARHGLPPVGRCQAQPPHQAAPTARPLVAAHGAGSAALPGKARPGPATPLASSTNACEPKPAATHQPWPQPGQSARPAVVGEHAPPQKPITLPGSARHSQALFRLRRAQLTGMLT